MDTIGTCTYDPGDNKLRLYPFRRLDNETYTRVRAAGFIWAPKQELFVAPAWTPDREDLLLELCEEIDDEDKSLVQRAEERAERFETFSEHRAADADRAKAAVSAIADNIPLGQPILIGHHSERHARRDAQKIENGMRRAVKMWEQSEYWKDRAAGSIRLAKYKERPDVRARRIQKLEAEQRKEAKEKKRAEAEYRVWTKPGLTLEQAKLFAGNTSAGYLRLPRKDGDKPDWDQQPSAYDGLTNSFPNLYAPRTLEEVIQAAHDAYPRAIARYDRWLAHLENRLTYERAMLAAEGGTAADRTRPEVGGAIGGSVWGPARGAWAYIQKVNKVTVTVWHTYNNGGRVFSANIPMTELHHIMTRAEVQAAKAAGQIRDIMEGTSALGFYLIEAPTPKSTPKEDTARPDGPACQDPACIAEGQKQGINTIAAEEFRAMRDQLRTGQAVQVVTADNLFPTPPEIAARMVKLAEIEPTHRVLEPSAGTGALLKKIPATDVVCVEINYNLAEALRRVVADVHCSDFLSCNGNLGKFDRVVMNPPFDHGDDIRHIKHALTFLKPEGILVALCANGPLQRAEFQGLAEYWEDLPAGSFKNQGTGVNVAMFKIMA
jgi:phospholipid N-methyltransferase